jgi:hypothetical protein
MKKTDSAIVSFLTDQILDASVKNDTELIGKYYVILDLYERRVIDAYWNQDKSDVGFSLSEEETDMLLSKHTFHPFNVAEA